MKKLSKSILCSTGVTLLEIMLVLAVAAMIIVMSVRYYQSASSSQQATAVLQQIQAVTAAADSLAQGSKAYAAVSTQAIANLINNGTIPINTVWGGAITIGTPTATTYPVTITLMPQAICTRLREQLSSNTRFTSLPATCAAGASSFTYTFDSTK